MHVERVVEEAGGVHVSTFKLWFGLIWAFFVVACLPACLGQVIKPLTH